MVTDTNLNQTVVASIKVIYIDYELYDKDNIDYDDNNNDNTKGIMIP